MRIISSFKDYYDIGLTYGIDPKCIYVRETTEYNCKKNDIPNFAKNLFSYIIREHKNWYSSGTINDVLYRSSDLTNPADYLETKLILFCGKAYLASALSLSYTYDANSTIEAIINSESPQLKSTVRKYESYAKSKYIKKWQDNIKYDYNLIDELNKSDKVDEILREASVPIILFYGMFYRDPNIVLSTNPNLSFLNFQKAVPPYEAFQELSHYINNILGLNENPTVDVSDISKIEGHGYDKKYSFRHPVKL